MADGLLKNDFTVSSQISCTSDIPSKQSIDPVNFADNYIPLTSVYEITSYTRTTKR